MTRSFLVLALFAGLVGCDNNADRPGTQEGSNDSKAKSASDVKTDKASNTDKSVSFGVALAPIEIEVSADAKTTAKAILARAKADENYIGEADRIDKNAEALVWIAASESSPKLVGEALSGLIDLEKPYPKDTATVVATRIRCKEIDVLSGLAGGLWVLYGDPKIANDEALAQVLVAAAKSHPNLGVRRQAVRALITLPKGRPERSTVVKLMVPDTAPGMLRSILGQFTPTADDPVWEEYLAARIALLTHANPAVRGAAAEYIAKRVGPSNSQVATKLQTMLADPEAYVRCSALPGLAQLGVQSSIPAIAKLLDDHTTCAIKYQLTRVTGPVRSTVGSTRSSVAMTAALALATLSQQGKGKGKGKKLTIKRVDASDSAAVAPQLAAAKAWARTQG